MHISQPNLFVLMLQFDLGDLSLTGGRHRRVFYFFVICQGFVLVILKIRSYMLESEEIAALTNVTPRRHFDYRFRPTIPARSSVRLLLLVLSAPSEVSTKSNYESARI